MVLLKQVLVSSRERIFELQNSFVQGLDELFAVEVLGAQPE